MKKKLYYHTNIEPSIISYHNYTYIGHNGTQISGDSGGRKTRAIKTNLAYGRGHWNENRDTMKGIFYMFKNNITYIIQTFRSCEVRGRRRAKKAIPTTPSNILPMWVYESIVADDRERENGYHCTRSCRYI